MTTKIDARVPATASSVPICRLPTLSKWLAPWKRLTARVATAGGGRHSPSSGTKPSKRAAPSLWRGNPKATETPRRHVCVATAARRWITMSLASRISWRTEWKWIGLPTVLRVCRQSSRTLETISTEGLFVCVASADHRGVQRPRVVWRIPTPQLLSRFGISQSLNTVNSTHHREATESSKTCAEPPPLAEVPVLNQKSRATRGPRIALLLRPGGVATDRPNASRTPTNPGSDRARSSGTARRGGARR